MATFDEILKKTSTMANRVASYTGVPKSLVVNIIHYAKCLTKPSTPDTIDDLIFIAQMGIRFGITSRYHVQLMLESIRLPKTNIVRLEDYVRMIATFASPYLDVKIDFVFNVYNFNGSGLINNKEIAQLLKNAIVPFGEDDTNEQLKEMIEMVISLVDTNQDGLLCLEEFRDYVRHNTLCLELFGKVFPNDTVTNSFLHILETRSVHKIKEYFANERMQTLGEPSVGGQSKDLFPGVVLDLV